MDGTRFDAWTKALAGNRPRRGALRLLAGGALGAALGLPARRAAADHGCRHPGVICSRDGQCCSGDCRTTCRCTRAGQCPQPAATEPCRKAVCTSTGKCALRNKTDGVSCGDGGTCQDGGCVPCVPDCAGKACGAGDGCGGACQRGSCTEGRTCGGGGTPGVCGACASATAVPFCGREPTSPTCGRDQYGNACQCVRTTGGGVVCTQGGACYPSGPICQTDADCSEAKGHPAGSKCVDVTGCVDCGGGKMCAQPCA